MSGLDLERVLAAHDGLGYDDCDGCACGADVRSWDAHRAHVTAVLREQIVAAQAEAWDEGFDRAEYVARRWGHVDNWWEEDPYPTNPYRVPGASEGE